MPAWYLFTFKMDILFLKRNIFFISFVYQFQQDQINLNTKSDTEKLYYVSILKFKQTALQHLFSVRNMYLKTVDYFLTA